MYWLLLTPSLACIACAVYSIYSFCCHPLNKHSPISQKLKDERGQKVFPQPYPHPYPNGWYKVADSAEVKKRSSEGSELFR